MPTSQNGWPASPDPSDIGIQEYRIPYTRRKVRLAAKAAPLLLAAASEWHRRIEPLDTGQLDDWGYCYRPIRGTTNTLSNHSSGSAIDCNSSKHPLGQSGTFTPNQREILSEIANKYGLRSGEFYTSRVDGMHLELAITPAAAAALIRKLGLNPDGSQKVDAPDFRGPYKRGDKGSGVLFIQKRLKYYGIYRTLPTGVFAGGTETAVMAFQKERKIKATGIVDLRTWNALAR